MATLNLNSNSLTGKIPSELFQAPLTTGGNGGFLAYNSFSSPLPSEIGNAVDFSYNFNLRDAVSGGGTLPTQLGSLSRLTQYFQVR